MGDLTYAIARPLIDDVLLVEETDFERAVAFTAMSRRRWRKARARPSLAALLAHPDRFRGKKVGLVLTGGNIDTRLLASVLTRELVRERRIVSCRIIGDDRPGLLADRLAPPSAAAAATSSRWRTTAWRSTCRPRARNSTS